MSRWCSTHELGVFGAPDPRSLQWHLSFDIRSEPAIDGIHVLVKRSTGKAWFLCKSIHVEYFKSTSCKAQVCWRLVRLPWLF